MAYVQAAVYDAVTKIAGRYVPYHDFTANAAGASPEAAIVAAAYSTLVAYLGDPRGTLKTKYYAALAELPDSGKAQGVAVGQAAAADIVAFRAKDGRGAPTATYGTVGPVASGAWQVMPPSTTARTPLIAFMQPFLLKSPSQFRPDPPVALSSRLQTTASIRAQPIPSKSPRSRTGASRWTTTAARATASLSRASDRPITG